MDDRQKLANLVNNDEKSTPSPYEHKDLYWGGSVVWYILIFFFIFIFILLIIISVEPICVYGDKDKRHHDKEDNNWVWAVVYAFFVTLIILFIIWILFAISSYTTSSC